MSITAGNPPPDVHMAGAIRPFAVCGSFTAAERHTRYPEDVTCADCLAKLAAAGQDQAP